MLLAAEFGTGQVLWSILWFYIFFLWIYLVIMIFGDIIRSRDMNGMSKFIWALVIIFLPYIGIFAYLIVRGGSMHERQMDAVQAQDEAMQSYIRSAAGGSADQLSSLADLHTSGKIDDAEYAKAKAQILDG